MLLAIDAGNTNIVLGLYRDKEIVRQWRVSTDRRKTGDEYGMLLLQIFNESGIPPAAIDGAVISSVVPSLNAALLPAIEKYIGQAPLLVGPEVTTGIINLYDIPGQLGTDRLVNAAAAFHLYGGPAIAVDFGTATKIDAVSAAGEYLGGVICPGIRTATESLFKFTDKLPRIELLKPERVIGRNTTDCMQSGVINGYAGMVSHLIGLMRKEIGTAVKVAGTGGLIGLMAGETGIFDVINPDLTLEGLHHIYNLNRQ
ncbi:MAG: type III pantothenate kinase [bacterium]|jgi:type III pantothenate kinase